MAIVNGMRPIHPGEILREEFLIPMNLNAHALAIRLIGVRVGSLSPEDAMPAEPVVRGQTLELF